MVALLLIIGIGKISDLIFHVEKPETPSYSVEIEQVTVAGTFRFRGKKVDIAALMALGDLASGEKVFKKCATCHSIVKWF